jgi:Ca2+-transporting ATPase
MNKSDDSVKNHRSERANAVGDLFETPIGLTQLEVARRQAYEGFNELPRVADRTLLRIILEVLREPMLALLLIGGIVYLLLGSKTEALMLLAFANLTILTTVVQESRTERVLEALRDLASPRALVIRDGKRQRVAGRDLVRGDIIIVAEGDRVPADASLLQASGLRTDESLLTGESVPVRKLGRDDVDQKLTNRPGGDDLPTLFSGSIVVAGTGVGEVIAIGAQTEMGKIGQSIGSVKTETPRIQKESRRLVRVMALIGISLSIAAVLLYGFLRGDWLDALLGGIALSMTLLPEEMPVVLAIFMAMGAWRISRANVLTRRATSIETLGSATVLCADKTGTLTKNQMAISEFWLPECPILNLDASKTEGLPETFHELVEYGILASAEDPFDPMEKAFHALGRRTLKGTEHLHHGTWQLKQVYGLSPKLLAMSHVWQPSDDDKAYAIATKGAPEAVADLCHLDDGSRKAVLEAADEMASKGLRVLGVAKAEFSDTAMPESQHDFAFEFIGLVGLADPLRAGVPQAIADCHSAGIRVIMITGDYPKTARAIAAKAGITSSGVVSGEDLDALDEEALRERVRDTNVFARIMPEQKLRIVNALKSNGEIVAMTGDGVNDAPSLKAAHIGIAMGERGTDVAREASSIVLLDDHFSSIVKSIKLGRRVYDNLFKAFSFIFAVHVPIAGMALLPLVLGLPIVFGPVHIAFLEMVIDPVCSLVFEAEPEEDDIMRRAPRDPAKPLFSIPMIVWSIFQGAVALGLVATIYLMALNRGLPEPDVRALTFLSLVTVIVSLIFINRAFSASPLAIFRRKNPALGIVLVAVVCILGIVLMWPAARTVFEFGQLPWSQVGIALGAGVLLFVILETLKPFLTERFANTKSTATKWS